MLNADALHGRAQASLWTIGGFLVLEVPLMWFGLFAWAFAVAVWLLVIVVISMTIFSRAFQNLVILRSWPRRPRLLSYGLLGLCCIATLPILPMASDVAYSTGQFGEAPNNRFIRLHVTGSSSILLELGVRATPIGNGLDLVFKFSHGRYVLADVGTGFKPPNEPHGSSQVVMLMISEHAKDDERVYLISANGKITPRLSLYLMFQPESGDFVLNDCKVQSPQESYEEGKSCADDTVKIIDKTGKGYYEPSPLAGPYLPQGL